MRYKFEEPEIDHIFRYCSLRLEELVIPKVQWIRASFLKKIWLFLTVQNPDSMDDYFIEHYKKLMTDIKKNHPHKKILDYNG